MSLFGTNRFSFSVIDDVALFTNDQTNRIKHCEYIYLTSLKNFISKVLLVISISKTGIFARQDMDPTRKDDWQYMQMSSLVHQMLTDLKRKFQNGIGAEEVSN
jgi:hypothetical protein